MHDPGKYDEICTQAREAANAVAALVIIVGGDKGNGFSVQTLEPDLLMHVPTILEDIARGIRAGNRERAAKVGH